MEKYALVIRRTTSTIGQLTSGPLVLANGQWGYAVNDDTLVVRDLAGAFHNIIGEDAIQDYIKNNSYTKDPVATIGALPSGDVDGSLRLVISEDIYYYKSAGSWKALTSTESPQEISVGSTGLFTWTGVKLVKVDATHVGIGPGTGHIITPDGTHTDVIWSGDANLLDAFVNSTANTFFSIEANGTIHQQGTLPTPTEMRSRIYLGYSVHAPVGTITVVTADPTVAFNEMSQVRDLLGSLGFINRGLQVSPNGSNLSINTTAGFLYNLGIGFATSTTDISRVPISAQTPATLQYRTQTGVATANATVLDVGYYDVAGTRTVLNPNKYTNQRVYVSPAGIIRMAYGQAQYNSMTAAVAAINQEPYTPYAPYTSNFALIGVVTVRSNGTNLSNIADGIFSPVSIFGETINAGSGVGITTLQQAYDNGSEPEILTNSIRGAVNIQRGSAADTDNVLQIQNGAGTSTFSVTGAGVMSASNLTSTQITDLTDAGASALHYHATDRARANHTGTQTASTISDFATVTDGRIDTKIATHVALADPHSQYRQENKFDYIFGASYVNDSSKHYKFATIVPDANYGSYEITFTKSFYGTQHFADVTIAISATNITGTVYVDASYSGRLKNVALWYKIVGTTVDLWCNVSGIGSGLSQGFGISASSNYSNLLTIIPSGTMSVDPTGLTAITQVSATPNLHAATHAVGSGDEVTKTMIGLGNVDNTSDLNKPISTATQTALNAKVTANTAITGATNTKITYDSKGLVTAGTTLVEADIPALTIAKTTGLQTALDGKQPLDADLTALAALSTTGVVKRTGTTTYTAAALVAADIPAHTNATGATVGIATTSLFGHVRASGATPLMDGTAAVGTDNGYFAREAHVHPTDTSRASSTHVHGNITNTGAIGTTAGLPIKTTTSGVLAAGAWGTTAGTFCQGNDTRVVNAHQTGRYLRVGTTRTDDDYSTVDGIIQLGAKGTLFSSTANTIWGHNTKINTSGVWSSIDTNKGILIETNSTSSAFAISTAASVTGGSPQTYVTRLTVSDTAMTTNVPVTLPSLTFANHPAVTLVSSSPGAGAYSLDLSATLRPTVADSFFLGDSTHAWKRADINAVYTERCELINYTANTTYSGLYGVDTTPDAYNFNFLVHRSGAVGYLNGTTAAVISHGGSGTALVNRVYADASGVILYGGVNTTTNQRVVAGGTSVTLYSGTTSTANQRLQVNDSVGVQIGTSASGYKTQFKCDGFDWNVIATTTDLKFESSEINKYIRFGTAGYQSLTIYTGNNDPANNVCLSTVGQINARDFQALVSMTSALVTANRVVCSQSLEIPVVQQEVQKPVSNQNGQMVSVLDTNKVYIWLNSAWRALN